jgi:flagellar protein FlaG
MSPISAQPIVSSAQSSGPEAIAPAATTSVIAAATPREIKAPAAVAKVDPAEMEKKLDQAVARLNEQMQANGRKLGFSVDDRLNKQIVRVMNKETGEVVRQIPNEVVIRVANSIEDLKGVLFDGEF